VTIEWLIATAFGLCTAGVTVVSFWIAFSDRITKAHAHAEAAMTEAKYASRRADEAHVSLMALSGAFSLYREQVAREYVQRDVLEQTENRIMNALTQITLRLDKVLAPGGK
jgi:hypothetical protein